MLVETLVEVTVVAVESHVTESRLFEWANVKTNPREEASVNFLLVDRPRWPRGRRGCPRTSLPMSVSVAYRVLSRTWFLYFG
ncbi:hypothetical protein C453_12866 [Haloferax elongans ATCC BAA-1513]|uniref:Uncharacterized protein n=1 Tax=Haloferax elongans ATCC BAA-1513 TaxID=1230453 RepID=M0HKX1_HALEO|nr:hypothetical protein C453_12866 [Haloferax elongans ATCC BAA-1513]